MSQRNSVVYTIPDIKKFKLQMLYWANRYNICCLLDTHSYPSPQSRIEWILAVGAVSECLPAKDALRALAAYTGNTRDWLFGHISYDVKNEIHGLRSDHPDEIGFPILYFFQPEIVLQLEGDQLKIAALEADPASVFLEIMQTNVPDTTVAPKSGIRVQPRCNKDEYLNIIQQIREHILKGDCYELNFCQEFFAEHANIDPTSLYLQLTAVSPNPFSCYYKWNDRYLICSSPERYLQKKGNKILSQPIKGTVKRDPDHRGQDEALKQLLRDSEKDKAENVMVVDLVRNDLSRICEEGSVQVEELFGIYSFPQVHQMISTVSGHLKKDTGLSDILAASFPMGSMTGAPKLRVMQLIEQYEKTKRGLYSGAVGYIDPAGDFDFNVVIRSLLYNQSNAYLSYQVGGGITFNSDPEKEYEECLIKASAIASILNPT